MEVMNRFSKKDEKDNVATALVDLGKNKIAHIYMSNEEHLIDVESNEMIPHGNKIALNDINNGDKIYKYGEVIGLCTEDIKKGDLVHVHNVRSLTVDIPKEFKKEIMRQIKIKQNEGEASEL